MRLRDWQTRLDACVRARLRRPFSWGAQDCCLFAADGVTAVTGVDPAADLRGSYADDRAALRVLQEHGGVEALAEARLGAPVAPRLAQPGDVGLISQDGRPTLALLCGAHWMAPGERGLVVVDASRVTRAWRCCRS